MPDIYQTFRQFLRENGCERQFDAAFYEQCGANVLDETLADILVFDEAFFGRVFKWDLTPEGRKFWKDIDGKWWKKYCESLDFSPVSVFTYESAEFPICRKI